ncbi:MAG: L-threonylcarbamoyladenylate synthase [Gaiellaceae bacterium MAG52_C11]|nr:L-threonylcarbamoyladenylate synthase [Candidatus Gaiellasilicea maunaloa]
MSSTVDEAVAALRSGKIAVVPTDTVYGLAAEPESESAVLELSRLKRRDAAQPIALVAADLDVLLERIPELRGQAERIVRALLPGPYTLVLPNPARRYGWLAGSRPDTIGVRIPDLTGSGRELLERVAAIAGTSANLSGGADPRTLDEVPHELRAAAAALVDGGPLPGTPSTVLDLSGAEPRVLREGAVPAADVLRIVDQVL